MATKGGIRIRWSEQELDQIIELASKRRWEPPYDTWYEALKWANQQLPAGRRKPENTLKTMSVTLRGLAEKRHAKKQAKALFNETQVIAADLESQDYSGPQGRKPEDLVFDSPSVSDGLLLPGPALTFTPEEWPDDGYDRPDPEVIPTDVANGSFDQVAQKLCDLLIERLKPLLLNKIKQAINPAIDSVVEQVVEEIAGEAIDLSEFKKPKVKARKPRVVVVGLISQQITTIKQEFADSFDLVFIESSQNYQLVKDRVRNADHVFINTTKIGHPLEQTIRKYVDADRISRVNGDLTSMKRSMSFYKSELDKVKEIHS